MSGYRIDLAVVHPKNPERYILGIECDGAMYHSSPSAKERDVYRQRFLESKGWKVTRIWSRTWWRNSSVEIERIDWMIKQMVESERVKQLI
jgi:very-short-patch-repair endonuclease